MTASRASERLISRLAIEPACDLVDLLSNLDRRAKRLIVVSVDAVLCVLAVWIAFSLRLGEWDLWSRGIGVAIVAALIVWFPIAARGGVYRAIFRIAGAGAMITLARAVALMTLAMVALFMIVGVTGVPRTIAIIQPMIFFLLMVMCRIVLRYLLIDLRGQRAAQGMRRRALIYGAGSAGQQLASSMRMEPTMALAGFVDDDPLLDGHRIDLAKISHTRHLADLIAEHGVTDILLAMPSIGRARRQFIVEQLQAFPVHVRTLPGMIDMVDGSVSISDLREVDIADLLGRDPVAPEPDLMQRTITGKVVMVTGAGGSIGSELCRQILPMKPARLILVEHSEYGLYAIDRELNGAIADGGDAADIELVPELVNVANAEMVGRVMTRWRPHTVFHAAAYKHVPLVEANVISGARNNVFGTLHAAEAAERVGVEHFILISTDKAVRPTNVMGATKRVCELVLQARAATAGKTRFAMVRFGNVLGSSGSVVPLFAQQIRDGGPVTVTHRDVTRYFMTIAEAAQLVIQAGAMAEGGEVYVLDMGKPVKIVDFAVSMIRLSGLTVRDAANPDGDIEIAEVGLRPGEKLYEELLIGDDPQPTRHERIMRATERMIAPAVLAETIDRLDRALACGDRAAVLALLLELVPEYQCGAAPDAENAAASTVTPLGAPEHRPDLVAAKPPRIAASGAF